MSRIAVGDVFLIPLDGERFGLGQIAGNWKGELYVVIYDRIVSADASPADLDGAEIQLAALTLDARLHHGHWRMIGVHSDAIARVPQPWFRIGVSGQAHIESRDRSVTRPATPREEAALRERTVVAPIRIEKAFQALHGHGDWLPHFDDLRPDYAYRSQALFGH